MLLKLLKLFFSGLELHSVVVLGNCYYLLLLVVVFWCICCYFVKILWFLSCWEFIDFEISKMSFLKIVSWIACYLLVSVVSPDPNGINTTHPLSRPRDSCYYGNLNCPSSYAGNVNACMLYIYIYVFYLTWITWIAFQVILED